MGEGKSSVIVPIIAASLANTKQLVRIVVLKPLWRQMFRLLVNRLAGLVNRRIYYLPFGRHIQMSTTTVRQLEDWFAECMREGGILLTQPDHILSLKLMSVHRLISGSFQDGLPLRALQGWLEKHTRDILDESDEILHAQYQLVYTVGDQCSLEDYPYRWTTTQQVLHLVEQHISRLERTQPGNFKYEPMKRGQFPKIRIMPHCKAETVMELLRVVANDVLDGRIPNFHSIHVPPPLRWIAIQFLTIQEFPYRSYEPLKSVFHHSTWRGLLLLRGLLASGILVFALKEKHYRVDYGLDLSRSQLAVPFRAKVLSPSSQGAPIAYASYRICQARKLSLDIQTSQSY